MSPPLPPLPIPETMLDWQAPRQVLVTEKKTGCSLSLKEVVTTWQVVMQKQGDSLHWRRFNLLGAPDARQILQDGRWRNDGFILPNKEARELFGALLFAWTSSADLPLAYSLTDEYEQVNENRRTREIYHKSVMEPPWWSFPFIFAHHYDRRWEIIWEDWPNQPDVFFIIFRPVVADACGSGVRIWEVRPL